MKINEILLRRKGLITIEKGVNVATDKEKLMVATIIKNVEAYGFNLSEEVINTLITYSTKDLEDFYKEIIPAIKKLVGADKEYNPMYPNFPKQVMEMEDVELFWNAIIHYISFGEILPEYEKEERFPLINKTKYKTLSIGTTEDLMNLFTNLVQSKTNLSQQDLADIETIVVNYSYYNDYLPSEIPLKENAAFVGKLILEKAVVKNANIIKKYFKTATDVLRLITSLSDGDISLANNTKYRNLKRSERRIIMDLLSECKNLKEDMFRYQNKWIRVGEIIHPMEYKNNKYKAVNEAFIDLRNNNKPATFGFKVYEAVTSGDMKKAARLLKNRPGEFARQLDKLIRDAKDKNYIINLFGEVANEVSTPVLIQVRQHFINRTNSKDDVRIFFPKGSVSKAVSIKNKLPEIEDKYCKNIIDICEKALVDNYRSKDRLGKIYVDDELKNYIMPFNQRTANSSSKIITKGSRLPISEDTKAIRGFIWWTNDEKSRVDLDLSAAVFDDNWNLVTHVSYTQLRNNDIKTYHSGDITNGGKVSGKGVAEFIDFDIDSILNQTRYDYNARYVVFQVYSFTEQFFSNLTNARFGWMERDDVNNGEIFEPSTVELSMDLVTNATVSIPAIFDCKERKVIWCDMGVNGKNLSFCRCANNVENNLSGISAACYAVERINKTSVYDLIMLNAAARGDLVTDRNEADIIFSNDLTTPIEMVEVVDEETNEKKLVEKEKTEIPIVSAFDLDYIVGQLL